MNKKELSDTFLYCSLLMVTFYSVANVPRIAFLVPACFTIASYILRVLSYNER